MMAAEILQLRAENKRLRNDRDKKMRDMDRAQEIFRQIRNDDSAVSPLQSKETKVSVPSRVAATVEKREAYACSASFDSDR